jgi:hypothetical protein
MSDKVYHRVVLGVEGEEGVELDLRRIKTSQERRAQLRRLEGADGRIPLTGQEFVAVLESDMEAVRRLAARPGSNLLPLFFPSDPRPHLRLYRGADETKRARKRRR